MTILFLLAACMCAVSSLLLASSRRNTLVMIIESSPTNLDPRVGIDAQSERIGELLFDALLTRDEHLNVQPGLAERWEIPDPADLCFPSAPRRDFSRRPPAHVARCEVDVRFPARRERFAVRRPRRTVLSIASMPPTISPSFFI